MSAPKTQKILHSVRFLTQLLEISIFRNIYILRMIRSALADRIIQYIKILRKVYGLIILLVFVVLCLSYISHASDMPIIHGKIFLFFLGITLDRFLKPNSSAEGADHTRQGQISGNNAPKEIALKILLPIDEIIYLEGGKGIKAAAYARVSTLRQAVHGESLQAQREELVELARSRGVSTLYFFADAKSGKRFSGRKLNAILQLAEIGEISEFLVRDVDRIGRESFELLGFIMQLRAHDVLTVTLAEEIDVKSLFDLVLTSLKAYQAEEENRRRTYVSFSSKIHNFKNRKWNMPIPIGYKKSGSWIEKIPDYEALIADIFNVFLDRKDYSKVAEAINEKYKNLLPKPLNFDRVASILTNPVYVGKPRFGAQNVEKLFGDVKVEDPALAFIPEEIFVRAQEIVKSKKEQYERKKKPIEELVEIFGYDILQCFSNVAPYCPICKKAMEFNGQSYICKEHKPNVQRRSIKKGELEKIAEWIIKREESLKTFMKVLLSTKNPDDILMKFKEKGILCDLSSY